MNSGYTSALDYDHVNKSFLLVSDGFKTPPARLSEEWDAHCGQWGGVSSSASYILHELLFLPQHPPPPFSLLLCTYTYKMTNFLHSPSMILHRSATYVEGWSQEAESFAWFHSAEMGGNDKFMANHEVLSCKLKKVQSRAIWQVSPSSLWIAVTFQDQPVFSVKNWEPIGHGLGNI